MTRYAEPDHKGTAHSKGTKRMAILKIRQAKIYDVPALARIERDSFASPWSAEDIMRDVAFNDRAYVAVAEIDGELVGYADMWVVAGEAQLFNIAVDPAYRRNTIGGKLLEHMAAIAGRSCRIMTLEVRRSNIPAIEMYRKKGFRDVGVRKKYYADNGEDAVLMDLDLDDRQTAEQDALETEVITDNENTDDDSLEVDIEIK